jgi:hypothetical protein
VSGSLFCARAEDLLSICKRPCDPNIPVAVAGEKPVQLLGDAREGKGPRPWRIHPESGGAFPGSPRKRGAEHEKNGTGSMCMIGEPLTGFCKAECLGSRTKGDFANAFKEMALGRHCSCEKMIVVCDSCKTRAPASFYGTFPAGAASEPRKRIEFRCAPPHGSWLNAAECLPGILSRECLGAQRFKEIGE